MQSPRALPVVVGALLNIRFEKDNQMHWLEKEIVVVVVPANNKIGRSGSGGDACRLVTSTIILCRAVYLKVHVTILKNIQIFLLFAQESLLVEDKYLSTW